MIQGDNQNGSTAVLNIQRKHNWQINSLCIMDCFLFRFVQLATAEPLDGDICWVNFKREELSRA